MSNYYINRPQVSSVTLLVALAHEKVTEEFAKVRVVRLVVETEGASVVEGSVGYWASARL